jgi:hypothetical protein
MHLFHLNSKAYFTSDPNSGALVLKTNQGQKLAVNKFEKDINLATLDLGYGLLGIDVNIQNRDLITERMVLDADEDPATIFYKIKYNKPLSQEDLAKTAQCQTITALNNNGKIQQVFSEKKEINLKLDVDKIAQWRKDFKVYFSEDLDLNQKADIIKSKVSETINAIHPVGHNMTFMVESQCYLDSRDIVLDQPLPIKILGFCYPDFRLFRIIDLNGYYLASGEYHKTKFWTQTISADGKFTNQLNEEILKKELTEVFRINLLAVIAEAQKVKQSLPFFINIPGAFLARLDDAKKTQIKTLIAESFVDLKKQYSSLIKENISEFIVLGSSKIWGDEPAKKFKEDQHYHTTTHIVDADMLDIVKKLHKEKGLVCPVPMMANPSHPIGCQYLDKNFTLTAFDEMLARRTGGLHRAIFEGGVIEQVTTTRQGHIDSVRLIDDDPVYKTFTKVQFDSCSVNSQKIFYAKNEFKDQDLSPSEIMLVIEIPIENKLTENISPHCFKVNQNSPYKDCSSIDVAPIFSTAVKNAVKDLEFLKDFENDPSQAKILFHIMVFANQKQGVGNKIADLKQYFSENYDKFFKDKDQTNQLKRIGEIAKNAKTFSYNFQQEMKNTHGFETGRIDAENQNVGARFHRMASKENIMQFFANTKFDEALKTKESILDKEFEDAKNLLELVEVSPKPLQPGKVKAVEAYNFKAPGGFVSKVGQRPRGQGPNNLSR